MMMRLACVFLLVFAQQTALTHAIWHFAGDAGHASGAGHASERHASIDPVRDLNAGTLNDALCAYHAALGEALGYGLSSVVLPLHALTAGVPHFLPSHSRIKAEAIAAVSRGPPFSL